MKTFRLFLLALACSIGIFSANAQSTDYLRVGGVTVDLTKTGQITSANILPVKQGWTVEVAYSHTAKTLFLHNAKIVNTSTSGFNYAIETNIDGLSIEVLESSQALVASGIAIKAEKDLKIKGKNSSTVFSLASVGGAGIALGVGGDCSITTINLVAQGKMGGIRGNAGALTISSSNVTAEGTSSGSITNFASFTMNNCGITAPEGAFYRFAQKGVVKTVPNGTGFKFEIVNEPVVIEKKEAYPLWINGAEISNLNCKNITAGVTEGGKVSFDMATKTLTLDKATLNEDSEIAIRSELDTLIIDLIGENQIFAPYADGIDFSGKKLIISGDGSIDIEGYENWGIHLGDGADLEILNTTISRVNGIYASSSSRYESINVNKSYVKVTENGIKGIDYFRMSNCKFVDPANIEFEDHYATVVKAGTSTKVDYFTINKCYDLWVAGKEVYPDEAADIKRPGVLTAGKMSYDEATNTLTLDGVTLKASSASGIATSITNLDINLVNKNKIESGNSALVIVDIYAAIIGSGELELKSTNDCGIFINKKGQLLIENTTVSAQGVWGIAGSETELNSLGINNSNVTIQGNGTNPSICDIDFVALQKCGFANPIRANFDASQKTVVLDGTPVTGKITIAPSVGYGIFVAGVEVTDLNKNYVLGDEKIKYNSSTNTLTLNNATIATTLLEGIINEKEGLTIESYGNNTIVASGENRPDGIYSSEDFSIKGSGSLNVESSGGVAIYADQCNLTIDNTTVTAQGLWGIVGNRGTSEQLTIKKSVVKATGTQGSICDLNSIVLEDCEIVKPNNAVIEQGDIILTGTTNLVTSEVVILPIIDGLMVAGTKVTNANAANILEDGKVSYDVDTKVLTLNNANILTTQIGIYNNGITDLTIQLLGTNKIDVDGQHAAIASTKNFTILGSGSITLRSKGDCGIYANTCNLVIDSTTINVEQSDYGIAGNFGTTEQLTIRKSNVKAYGLSGAVCDFKTITLEDCFILLPEDAVVKGGAIEYEDGGVVADVEIVPLVKYNIFINGEQVTNENNGDVLRDGSISYDAGFNELTLDGMSLIAANGITNEEPDLTIRLENENKIESNTATIVVHANTTITGNGSIDLKTLGNGSGIFISGGDLLIENTTLKAVGKWGIAGHDDPVEVLTIRKSHVEAQGNGAQGSICDLKNVILEECSIEQPTGAAFDATKNGIAFGGVLVSDKIVISTETAVQNVLQNGVVVYAQNRILTVENGANKQISVFNSLGQCVANTLSASDIATFALPTSGIYFVKVGNETGKVVVK